MRGRIFRPVPIVVQSNPRLEPAQREEQGMKDSVSTPRGSGAIR